MQFSAARNSNPESFSPFFLAGQERSQTAMAGPGFPLCRMDFLGASHGFPKVWPPISHITFASPKAGLILGDSPASETLEQTEALFFSLGFLAIPGAVAAVWDLLKYTPIPGLCSLLVCVGPVSLTGLGQALGWCYRWQSRRQKRLRPGESRETDVDLLWAFGAEQNICVTSPSVTTTQWHKMQGLRASSCPCFDQGYFWAGFKCPGPTWALQQGEGLSSSLLIHPYALLVLPCAELNVFSSLSCSVPHEEFCPGNITFFFAISIFWEIFWIFFYTCTCLHSSSLWQRICIGGDPYSSGWLLFLSAFRSRGVYIIKQGIFLVYWAFPVVLSTVWRISGSNCSGSCRRAEAAVLQDVLPRRDKFPFSFHRKPRPRHGNPRIRVLRRTRNVGKKFPTMFHGGRKEKVVFLPLHLPKTHK